MSRKHNMNGWWRGVALLLCWGSSAVMLASADALDAAHHGRDNSCRLCHGEQRMPAPDASAKCVQCHQHKKVPSTVSSQAGVRGHRLGLASIDYPPGLRLGDRPNEMVLIAAGPFIMGSNSRLEDEGPEQRVALPAYYIDRYEVTNLQYQRFINDTGHRSPGHFSSRRYPQGKADHPVTFVSWQDAQDYCQWAGKRLPDEAEWEKAARGSDGRIFPWGSEFDISAANTPVRWASLGQDGDTTPVGAFPRGRSPYGLDDMSGNVWEWTASWYQPHPGNHHPSENYGEIYKVLKGGSWWDCSYYKCGISAPAFNRSFFNPRVRNSSFGFRCARDAGKGR
ncbi:MAG: formylglycine-generating enzyme family protein [Gammaproteobacteria bacterium]|nr:formylglycine-generating enzyme family protein [Gammaproteobacteria bacterium]